MDKGYAVAVKKLGTIGCTVQIMRPGTRLPHEISIFSDEELRIRAEQAAAAEAAAPQSSEASE
jgi:small subunit ribosomal protein S3